MKYVLILWLCINEPTITAHGTCETLVLDDKPLNSFIECRYAAELLWEDIKSDGRIFMSSFCAQKV